MTSSPDNLVQQLARRYTAGAAGYAAHWQPMLAPMSAGLLTYLPLAGARRILDVGCGAGALFSALADRAAEAHIAGVDPARGMLRYAPPGPRVSVCQMDGRRLAFGARTFDVAVLAFVLFHFPDLAAGLREAWRVLQAGGSAGTATFQSTPGFEASRVWAAALKEALPAGRSPVRDLSAVDQGDKTNAPGKLHRLFEQAGFRAIQTHTRTFVHRWQPERYLAVRASFGSSGAAFRTLDASTQAALLDDVRARFAHLPPEAFRFAPTVIYTTGRRPA